MNAEQSHRIEKLFESADMMDVGGECDAHRSFDDNDEEECVEIGFDLAMKLARMSATEKYAGKNLQVFYADEGGQSRFYFIGVDEDEVVKRVEENCL